MRRRFPRAALLIATFALVACEGETTSPDDDSQEEDRKKKKKRKKEEETVPAKAPVPKAPPSPVNLEAMTWTEEGTTRALQDTELTKRCLLKGMKMVLPEGAPLKPLMGSRGCVSRAWGEKGPYLYLVSDELPVNIPPIDEMKNVKRVIEKRDDAWLAEFDDKNRFAARTTTKVGKRTYWCTANANGVADEKMMRGMLALCSTLKAAEADDGTEDEAKPTAPKRAAKPFDKKKHAQSQNAKLKGMFGN